MKEDLVKKLGFQPYDGSVIDKLNCVYNITVGERSNGKTFYRLRQALLHYLETGKQSAYLRRFNEDFIRGRGQRTPQGIVDAGVLKNTIWEGIDYRQKGFWLYRYDEQLDKKIYDKDPFCFTFSLASMEHDKSTSYDNVDTIIFDEFLTRKIPLPDEFVIFMNAISTIARNRSDVKIYMLANTVSWDSEYFREMGISNIKKQKQGTIDVYKYGDSDLTVAVEYCKSQNKGKPSDKYFAFNNPKLQMITGGAWELAIYPHKPTKWQPKHVLFTYYIRSDFENFKCEIVRKEDMLFTYVSRIEIKNLDMEKLIFSKEPNPRKNWRRKIDAPFDETGKKIWDFFVRDKVYYENNEVGEMIRNYLVWCRNYSIIKA